MDPFLLHIAFFDFSFRKRILSKRWMQNDLKLIMAVLSFASLLITEDVRIKKSNVEKKGIHSSLKHKIPLQCARERLQEEIFKRERNEGLEY